MALYNYKVPKSLYIEGIPTSVGMRQLGGDQELLAIKRGGGDQFRTLVELTKQSIATLDGNPVDWANDDVNRFWDKAPPQLRTLLLNAYQKMHNPTEEETDGFFESQTITDG